MKYVLIMMVTMIVVGCSNSQSNMFNGYQDEVTFDMQGNRTNNKVIPTGRQKYLGFVEPAYNITNKPGQNDNELNSLYATKSQTIIQMEKDGHAVKNDVYLTTPGNSMNYCPASKELNGQQILNKYESQRTAMDKALNGQTEGHLTVE